MATAEHDGVATALEPDLAEPCILSVMDGPVRVRARVLRPLLRVLCPRAPAGTRRPHRRAVRPWLLLYCAVCCVWLAGWQAHSCRVSCTSRAGAAGAAHKRENREWPVDGVSLSPLLAAVRHACAGLCGAGPLVLPMMRAFFQYFWHV